MNHSERLSRLDRHQRPTDRTDKSISVGFVSSLPARMGSVGALIFEEHGWGECIAPSTVIDSARYKEAWRLIP
jgi:hypothetical protein